MPHVLVVDDSSTEVSGIQEILKANGYRVSIANSGEECLSIAGKLRPDLVLMDVIMPGMSGFQATRKLTRDPVTASIPVVIISSKNAESDKVWGLRQGARDYIAKPFSAEVLIRAVKKNLRTAV
ncbi:MAG: response regulator [Gammaproteobacteria bacterium]|nr:response regulator [Gammaproteobacteria bacterium]